MCAYYDIRGGLTITVLNFSLITTLIVGLNTLGTLTYRNRLLNVNACNRNGYY